MDRLLISGIASPLGERLAAAASSRMEVCGIDRVAARTLVDGRPLRAFVLDPRTRRLDDVLGQERPDAIVHFPGTGGTPLDGRVLGDTLRVLEAARDAGVPQVVVLSSALVYGANNAARPFRDEDAAVATAAGPSRFHAGVAPDVAAALFGAQHIETRVAVLRAVGTLGHRAASGLGLLLQPGLVPLTLGHDPLIQLLHSDDLVEALLAAARHGLRGVFNVSGPDPLPLSLAVQESGGSASAGRALIWTSSSSHAQSAVTASLRRRDSHHDGRCTTSSKKHATRSPPEHSSRRACGKSYNRGRRADTPADRAGTADRRVWPRSFRV